MANYYTKAERQAILKPGYKHVLSKTEREEAEWLVKDGTFDSVEEFIKSRTKANISVAQKEEAAYRRKWRNKVKQ